MSVRIRFDQADFDQVRSALDGQELWPYWNSRITNRQIWKEAIYALESHYSKLSGTPLWAVPVSSGTAAIHVALGGLQIPAGSEVIVPPITDMGTVMPVIFQNAIPVFADVDEKTGLLTKETIEAAMTERTSAVIVVHLSGSPADMDPIMALCRAKGVKVIEDAAQALGASYKGKPAGTLADAGCFSLNAQKHITTGEGGFVLVRSEDTFKRCLNFSDKHYNRKKDSSGSEHYHFKGVGLNYRMSDLELSLLLSQLPKMGRVTERFTAVGRRLDQRLEAIDGVAVQSHHSEAVPSYFFHMFRLEEKVLDRRSEVYEAMKEAARSVGMSAFRSYVRDPLYQTPVFLSRNFFDTIGEEDNANPVWPAELVALKRYPDLTDDHYRYQKTSCPKAEGWIRSALGVRLNDSHTPMDADVIAEAIEAVLT